MAVNYLNDKDVIKSLGKFQESAFRDFDKRLYKSALIIENTAKTGLQTGSRSGRTYKRRSVTHKASAPGEYPKTDTGKLVRNIFSMKVGSFHYIIGSRGNGAPHGKWLEFGTMKMRPRPWLSRALRESVGKISDALFGKLK